MSVAVTDDARARLQEELKQTEEDYASATPEGRALSSTTASMVTLRLDEEEIGTRALPVLGMYSKVNPGSPGVQGMPSKV